MKLIILDSENVQELQTAINEGKEANIEDNPLAIVASGSALFLIFEHLLQSFYELSQRCNSVICCRVSPLQKASIVRLIRDKTQKVCLAIGDGANDVGMILEADVGIGISGKEGMQAVLSSDYSFAQFSFLKKLLLVHGRINFYRNVELTNYCFYKNMVFTLNQILFLFYSGFSGNTMYDSVLYTLFNVIFSPCTLR